MANSQFLDKQVFLAPTPIYPSPVRKSLGFSFCQRIWDLTKRRNGMVADMEVDKVADKVADMAADKKTKLMCARKWSVSGRTCCDL